MSWLRALSAILLVACASERMPSDTAGTRENERSEDAGGMLEAADGGKTPVDSDAGPPRPVRDASTDPPPPRTDASIDPPPPRTDASIDAAHPHDDEDDAGSVTQPESDASTDRLDATVSEPDPEVAALLDWVLDTLDQGRRPTGDEITRRFSPEFLRQIPETELADTLVQLSLDLRPITRGEPDYDGLGVTIRLETALGPQLLDLTASHTTPRRIFDLRLQPAPIEADGYDDILAALPPLAASAQLLAARVSPDGSCAPIVEHDPTERLAIGSAFKLWVLLALSQKLTAEPELSWTTRIPIREALKSLPSGVLQNQPAGTQLTLDEYASKMIEISDNTATDHLIEFVGRTAVEQAQLLTRHGSPDANIPWLMTRELFVLKLALPEADVEAYRAASVPEKRTLLESYRDVPLDLALAADWTEPRALDLEWFATPLDLCHVLATLGARAGFQPSSQLLRVLGRNPGIEFNGTQWSYTGYKGGSEPGVLNLSFLLQRIDGAWFSVILTLNDNERILADTAAISVVSALVPLLAAEP